MGINLHTDQQEHQLRLPPELWVDILQLVSLRDVVAFSTTCHLFLQIATSEPGAWSCLEEAAAEAGAHVFRRHSRCDSESEVAESRERALRRTLAALAGSVYSPPALAWARLLPILSRAFVLYELEPPRLTAELWESVLRRRFTPSLAARTASNGNGGGYMKSKERFLRTLARLDHRADTHCGQEEHMVRSKTASHT